MKKTLPLILGAALFCSMFTACGNNNKKNDANNSSEAEKITDVNDNNVHTNENSNNAVEQIVTDAGDVVDDLVSEGGDIANDLVSGGERIIDDAGSAIGDLGNNSRNTTR